MLAAAFGLFGETKKPNAHFAVDIDEFSDSNRLVARAQGHVTSHDGPGRKNLAWSHRGQFSHRDPKARNFDCHLDGKVSRAR